MKNWKEWEWPLDAWLKPELIADSLPALKILFWLLTGFLILQILRYSIQQKQTKFSGKAHRILLVSLAVLFAAILGYQATWQLAGFARPDFVQFMKRYNRRPDNPAARIIRGRILDARGVILAETDPFSPTKRWYPQGIPFCHVIGYDHPIYGLAGIESADHAQLSGITRDSGPEWQRFRRNLLKRDEIRGHDVALTLLSDLQKEAHVLMKGRKGAVVVLDATNGGVLALYSSPGFDPENLQSEMFERNDRDATFLNRSLQGLYPAGSTLKILVAATALEHEINPMIDCPAEGYKAGSGNRPIRDHEYYDYQRQGRVWPGHGTLNMRSALAKSSNIYFARLGVQVGGDKIYAVAQRCGLDRAWPVFRGSSGTISSSKGKFPALTQRDVANTAQISIGQGNMLVTPLHMAMLAAAIGREGETYQPRLSAAAAPELLPRFFPADASRTLAGMMRYSVVQGTGRAADIPGLDVAGKTGTAQNPHGADHGWFVGFAPVSKPRVAFAVVVEQGGYGSESAVPISAGILRKAKALGLFDGSEQIGGRATL